MRQQIAWLELHGGMWHLLTDVREESVNGSRKWADKKAAISELSEEGWKISGPYPNRLSRKLNLGDRFHGYALMRSIH
jgi:hypothetical protein